MENGEHTHKGKESHPTHPLHMEGTNRTKVLLSSNSNARHGNVVEIHGDLRGLEKESIEMYLENTRRSGGGEVKEIDWDATPPRVIFRDPEGDYALCFIINSSQGGQRGAGSASLASVNAFQRPFLHEI